MKLSVLMITYNHEKFIAQALDSVLMQEVNFDYEIVIGEDFSTDTTREIVIRYQKKYPEKIRLLLPEKNLGMIKNFVATFKACKGEYIALLEGDDYWTAPDKLQIQVDYLDKHPDCAISFHNCEEFYDDSDKPSWYSCSDDQKEISTIEDLISKCNFIPTCSQVFRNGLFDDFPDWYYSLEMGDWTLNLLNAQYGNIGYINKVMGRYRLHEGGVWSMRNQAQNIQDVIKAYQIIDIFFNYKYHPLVIARLTEFYYDLCNIYKNSDKKIAIKYYKHLYRTLPNFKIMSLRYIGLAIRILAPFPIKYTLNKD